MAVVKVIGYRTNVVMLTFSAHLFCLSLIKCLKQIRRLFVAVKWSVESLPSNPAAKIRLPARFGILICILGLGVYSLPVLCPVLSMAVVLTFC